MDIKGIEKGNEYSYLEFNPRTGMNRLTCRYIHDTLALYFDDKVMRNKIMICIRELLENTIKYAHQPKAALLLAYLENKEKFKLHVFNPVSPKQLDKVRKIFEQMHGIDPWQYYLGKVKESVNKKNGESEIGLARIQYEAHANVSMQVYSNQELGIQIEFKNKGNEAVRC